MIDHAVAVKDRLWSMLNDPTPDTRLSNIEVILTVLEYSQGLWAACNYAYKGYELAKECRLRLDMFLGGCQSWRRIERIERLRQSCFVLEHAFNLLQQERMAA